MSETVATPPKRFAISTIETIHRMYVVEAEDEESAKKRLRLSWNDSDALREGIVVGPEDVALKSRQIKGAKVAAQVARRPVRDNPQA